MRVIKRNGDVVRFNQKKVEKVLRKAFSSAGKKYDSGVLKRVVYDINDYQWESTGEPDAQLKPTRTEITVEELQDVIEATLMDMKYFDVAKSYIIYRKERSQLRDLIRDKEEFINKYKQSSNTANATIDDNSNVASKNIGIINAEIWKNHNVQINRGMVMRKLHSLYPDFDSKQYINDLEKHIIYKHDESTFAGAIAPYCVSVSMYQFLINGLKGLGGLSAAPKNLDSYCGMYINFIFAIASQFAGAVATSEFLLYFDYFARREFGEDYYLNYDNVYKIGQTRKTSIKKQIHQYFQQVVYSINQPAASRGMQSAFVNFSYFDKPFFEGMFGDFYFPDGTQPKWESLSWLQKEFMMWFNEERNKCVLTFPVESFALVYKDGKFQDEDSYEFVCEEYERGHSFFTYISDSVDSLSSCCRLKNKLQTKEFNFTNGNIGIMTGSKSVLTLNLNRITQDFCNKVLFKKYSRELIDCELFFSHIDEYKEYINTILERVYKYHNAYNELLYDMYNSNLLPAYSSKFIDLKKQYLTIGLNGLNEAAEFIGIVINDNEKYSRFCQELFGTIKESNTAHKTDKLSFNTECVPAESLAIKNYNWDKEDGYWVPKTSNLYASYIYLPSSQATDVFECIRMHGRNYIGDYLDGGSAAHINLKEHLSKAQYKHILNYSAENGCQYLTFNVPMSECRDCGHITKAVIKECGKCGSKNIDYYDRVIGYLTKIKNWSDGRQKEQKTRIYKMVSD